MGAFVHVIDEKDFPILKKYLDEEGVVLISPSLAEKLEAESGISLDGQLLDKYDFGGDADMYVDLVSSMEHYAAEAIKEEFRRRK